ncbi:MAG: DNA gyrase modulator, partial [Acidobacteriota bacterium]
MDRRKFLRLSGVGLGGVMLVPVFGESSPLLGSTTPIPGGDKKTLADVALNAAKAAGASYADIRIGRYRNQFVVTREERVDNLVNTESYGLGIRVLANGTWGFAATSDVTKDSIAAAAKNAVAVAKANSKLQLEPVTLAPVKGVGEVSWRTPIEKDAFEVPIKDKVDLLMTVNQTAMKSGANFVNSMLFLVNEQKYFASTDGSYIDQDVHRLWPTFTVTVIDPESGKFQTRDAMAAPMGMGWEYMDGKKADKV